MSKTDSPIIITLEVFPLDGKGKRKLVISGAPTGEMPVMRTGIFSERHQLLDEVWTELGTRKPQVVKHPAAKKDEKKAAGAGEAATTETSDSLTEPTPDELRAAEIANDSESEAVVESQNETTSAEQDGDSSEPDDQLVASGSDPEQLPLIANDPTAEVSNG